MGLVDYSDSEGSDAEQTPSPTRPKTSSQKASISSKPAFNKVVDRANPHKIKVSLPGIVREPDQAEDERPAKKARAGGGFNSFLPAPKNLGKSSVGDAASKPRTSGLGRGVNLRTAAAPAFSRAAPPVEDYEPEDTIEPAHEDKQEALPEANSEPNDSASMPKKAMFRPLSVARKPDKKTKNTQVADTSLKLKPSVANVQARKEAVPTPKRSLFASVEIEEEAPIEDSSNGQYEPLFQEESADGTTSLQDIPQMSANDPTSTPNLETLANTLNLTAAQRRQLFGRSGVPTNAQISQFSVSQEYSHNQAMLASGQAVAPAHNPVRSIAPGKHSLQQLLNAANSQKDALEESFAVGRRNKKEAGSRYGW